MTLVAAVKSSAYCTGTSCRKEANSGAFETLWTSAPSVRSTRTSGTSGSRFLPGGYSSLKLAWWSVIIVRRAARSLPLDSFIVEKPLNMNNNVNINDINAAPFFDSKLVCNEYKPLRPLYRAVDADICAPTPLSQPRVYDIFPSHVLLVCH